MMHESDGTKEEQQSLMSMHFFTRNGRICGLKKVVFYILLGFSITAVLSVSITLIVLFVNNDEDRAVPAQPKSLHPTNYTQSGTSVATARLNDDGDTLVYYQLRNGSIIEQQLQQDPQSKDHSHPSIGSPINNVVKVNATNYNTPMSVTSYILNGRRLTWLFYLDDRMHINQVNITDPSIALPPIGVTTEPIPLDDRFITSCYNPANDTLNVFYVSYRSDSTYGRPSIEGLVQMTHSANSTPQPWTVARTWDNTISTSGLSCYVSTHSNGTSDMHLFSRTNYNITVPDGGPPNPVSGRLQHWVQSTTGVSQVSPWREAAEPDHNDTSMYIVDGSGVATGSSVNGSDCNVVYYNADGKLRRWNFDCFDPMANLSAPGIVDMAPMKPGAVGLMPGDDNAGVESLVLYQDNDIAMRWSSLGNATASGDGKIALDVVGNGTLPVWRYQ